MLGNSISDNKGIESESADRVDGLALLDTNTYFENYQKVTELVSAVPTGHGPILERAHDKELSGYEIHMGKTTLGSRAKPAFRIVRRGTVETSDFDGAVDETGLVFGTYMHGIFDKPALRESLVTYLASRKGLSTNQMRMPIEEEWEKSLSKIVEAVKKNLDINWIIEIIGLKKQS
jgi:adenosylcobyric acid synthase